MASDGCGFTTVLLTSGLHINPFTGRLTYHLCTWKAQLLGRSIPGFEMLAWQLSHWKNALLEALECSCDWQQLVHKTTYSCSVNLREYAQLPPFIADCWDCWQGFMHCARLNTLFWPPLCPASSLQQPPPCLKSPAGAAVAACSQTRAQGCLGLSVILYCMPTTCSSGDQNLSPRLHMSQQ